MTDPADKVDAYEEEIAAGVSIEFNPAGGGEIKLKARYDGDTLADGQYSSEVFAGTHKGRTERGEFLNTLEESLDQISGVDAGSVRTSFRQWFSEMGELDKEEQAEYLLTDEIQAIIEGTHYPVEVHGGETTTWNVQLTFAGRTSELEFTADEMVSNGGGALQQKIANDYFEFVEIEPEDWDAIRERWQENKEVVQVVTETASGAVADRVLSYIGNNLMPVADREKMGNDVAACWYDENNETVYDDAGADDAIVWVQDDFLVDQLEAAGKQVDYKGQLAKDLIARGDLHGSRVRKKWAWSTRTKLYPFKPESLGVTADDVADGDDPAHSEVGV